MLPPPSDTAEPEVLRVALSVPVPRLFDYAIGDTSGATVGCRVRVPFGSRELVGVVADVVAAQAVAGELRPATASLDATPLLGGELLESLRWLARYTHAPLGRDARNRVAGGAAPG